MIGIGYYFAKNLHRILFWLQRVEVIIALSLVSVAGAYLLIKRRKRQRAKQEQQEQLQQLEQQRDSLPRLETATRSSPSPSE